VEEVKSIHRRGAEDAKENQKREKQAGLKSGSIAKVAVDSSFLLFNMSIFCFPLRPLCLCGENVFGMGYVNND
jgi:hypothetical protein